MLKKTDIEYKTIYKKAINDAREILINESMTALDNGKPSDSLLLAEASRKVSDLIRGC